MRAKFKRTICGALGAIAFVALFGVTERAAAQLPYTLICLFVLFICSRAFESEKKLKR